MNEHQAKEQGEWSVRIWLPGGEAGHRRGRFDGGYAEERQPADELAEPEEFFSGEVAVSVLIAEEHADNCGDGERIQDPGLLGGVEFQAGEVAINQRQPASPDEKLQYHHQEEPEADRMIHSAMPQSLGESSDRGKRGAKLARRLSGSPLECSSINLTTRQRARRAPPRHFNSYRRRGFGMDEALSTL